MIYFQPRSPPGDLHRDLAPPRLDTAFYTDLGARAITAVEEMKKVRMRMMMMMMIIMMVRLLVCALTPAYWIHKNEKMKQFVNSHITNKLFSQ